MSLLDQLPRLSAYDPGATGEGGLDPLGLGAVADRIADILAPGVRARMSQPRFVTLSAVGAIANQALHGVTADDGGTTVDIAFEWLVVEAIVRHPGAGRTEGLPGNQKAARAKQANERLSRRTYLNGPRVFGFTGVYRPFSRDASVLTLDDRPAANAEALVDAWERDFGLDGFVSGVAGTPGGRLRADLAEASRRTLESAECAAPPTGRLLQELAEYLAPREARSHERRALRTLVTSGEHDLRNELTARLAAARPASDVSQRDLARQLLTGASVATRRALQAAINYEEAATAIDNAFRRFLHYTAHQHGCVIEPTTALQTPGLSEAAPRIGDLSDRALASVAELDDADMTNETERTFRLFRGRMSPSEFFHALVERHEEVQAAKHKLAWIDRIDGSWTVRTPYRSQSGNLDDERWAHPMRLTTLARFIAETTT